MGGDSFFAKARKRKTSRKRRGDEELDSARTDSDGSEDDINDLDLKASYIDEYASGEEYDNETPAQKRLRLARVYLQSVKDELGWCYIRDFLCLAT
jgi:ribosomal RNA-processing protein 9